MIEALNITAKEIIAVSVLQSPSAGVRTGLGRSDEADRNFYFLSRCNRDRKRLRLAGHCIAGTKNYFIARGPCACSAVFDLPSFDKALSSRHLSIIRDIDIHRCIVP